MNVFYKHLSIPPPKIRSAIFQKVLLTSTTKAPFYNHNGNTYIQANAVSIGNPLGPAFCNFYMSHIENKVFKTTDKLQIYTRHVDDIFVLIKSKEKIINVK